MTHHYKYTTDVHPIYARKQFEQLDEKEKQYTYYFSKASVEGEKICLFEVSHEAPAIFALIHLTFLGQDMEELKKRYAGKEVTYQRLIAYCGSFMAQLGNYRSFASTKFVPEATPEEFYELIKSSPSYHQYGELIEELWAAVKGPIYDLSPEVLKIGQWPKGVTGYYSNNLTAEELDLADELLAILNVSELNTHVYKKHDETIVIKVVSINQKTTVHNFKKRRFELEYGFVGSFLRRVVENLQKAHEYASNITQKKMIEAYI
jgi:dipeptidyl-peptidase-3